MENALAAILGLPIDYSLAVLSAIEGPPPTEPLSGEDAVASGIVSFFDGVGALRSSVPHEALA